MCAFSLKVCSLTCTFWHCREAVAKRASKAKKKADDAEEGRTKFIELASDGGILILFFEFHF